VVPYYLSKYDPDPLRFYLTATASKTRDTEACPACPEQSRGEGLGGFSWEDLIERNNLVPSASEGNELVATWGNLSQRPSGLGFMLSFAYKRFDGVVPEPGALDDEDRALLQKVEAGFETVQELYNACKFRAAPFVPSGQAWAKRWRWPARPTATHSLRSVQAWTARRPGSRSRRIRK